MSTEIELIGGMFGHSVWANDKLLAAAANLTPAQLDTEIPGGYGTVRETLLHLVSVQRGWLRRYQELDPIAPLDPAAFPSINEISAFWNELNDQTNTYIASLTAEQLQEIIHMKFWSGDEGDARRWQALLHFGMHQHQHRGELAAILTAFGYSPGEIDVFDYFESLEQEV